MVEETAHAEWLEARQHSIGASEVPIVLGQSPWATPLDLYLRKRGMVPAIEQTPVMEAGHRLEPVIADWYADESGRQVIDLGRYTIQRRDDLPFMTCTLDRQIMPCDGHDMPGTLQCKNVTAYKAADWENEAPIYVQIQVQAEMAVTSIDWGSIAALIGGNHFVWEDKQRHDNFIDYMVEQCRAFWRRVENGDPPDATAKDNETLNKLWPDHVPEKVIDLHPDASDWYDDLVGLESAKKTAEDGINEIKARIKQAMGDAEKAISPCGAAWTWKTQHRDAYTVQPSTTRVLRTIKRKGA